jgi:hypothetical protein
MNPELVAARVQSLVRANQRIQRERKLSSIKRSSSSESIKEELKQTPPLTPPLKGSGTSQSEKIDDCV